MVWLIFPLPPLLPLWYCVNGGLGSVVHRHSNREDPSLPCALWFFSARSGGGGGGGVGPGPKMSRQRVHTDECRI
jgi:hypothetical protein